MKVAITNWIGVLILLCIGIISGGVITILVGHSSSLMGHIGRYQLVSGIYTTEGTQKEEIKTVFRINTENGEVERFYCSIIENQKTGAFRYSESWLPCRDSEIKWPENNKSK